MTLPSGRGIERVGLERSAVDRGADAACVMGVNPNRQIAPGSIIVYRMLIHSSVLIP